MSGSNRLPSAPARRGKTWRGSEPTTSPIRTTQDSPSASWSEQTEEVIAMRAPHWPSMASSWPTLTPHALTTTAQCTALSPQEQPIASRRHSLGISLFPGGNSAEKAAVSGAAPPGPINQQHRRCLRLWRQAFVVQRPGWPDTPPGRLACQDRAHRSFGTAETYLHLRLA